MDNNWRSSMAADSNHRVMRRKFRGWQAALSGVICAAATIGFFVGILPRVWLRQGKAAAGTIRSSDEYGCVGPLINDPFDGLRTLVNGPLSSFWIPHIPVETFVFRPLSSEERQQLRSTSIDSVNVQNGGEASLAFTPKLFGDAHEFNLYTSNNGKLIRALRANYPDTRYLSVHQNSPLTLSDLREISRFKSLVALQLFCPVDPAVQSPDCIPNTLKTLSMRSALPLPPMPNLLALSIENSTITKTYLSNLQAPHLHSLSLANDVIVRGALAPLQGFNELRCIGLEGSSLDMHELRFALELPYASVFLPERVKLGVPNRALIKRFSL